MAANQQALQFDPRGAFYRLVAAYKMGLCGQLIFHPNVNIIYSAPVGIASNVYGALSFSPQELVQSVRRENLTVSDVTDGLVYMLINLAYATCQDRIGETPWLDLRQRHPEIEFFRHLRNAASHGGVWNFRQNEPRPDRAAEWRGRTISRALQGTPIWDVGIQPGDVLVLLWDVEQVLRA
jgi:hypothetical protein